MARISGVDLPRDKRVEIGLTYVYGIGLTSSQRILKEANKNLQEQSLGFMRQKIFWQLIRKASW